MPFTKETATEWGKKNKRGLSERTKILNELFDPNKATQVFEKLQEQALTGDLEAIRLFMAYCFGKPKESLDVTTDGDKISSLQVEIIRRSANEAANDSNI